MWIEPNDAASWPPSFSSSAATEAGHDHDLVLEAPARVERPRDVVRRQDLEVEVVDIGGAKRREHLPHQLGPDPAAAGIARDVEIGERPEPRGPPPGEREPDRRPVVVLGDEGDLGVDDLPYLGELLLDVRRPLVGRRRDFVVELPPEVGDRLEVLGCRTPYVHRLAGHPRTREEELR